MLSGPLGEGGLQICTIVARNYLPAARVLAASFLANNPGGRIAVLVIDDVLGVVDPAREPFEVLRPEDLFSDPTEVHRMATIYEITEFATSMKPWLLEHLLDRGAESVLYLDPDIGVFDRLDELADVARDTGIALIPHARSPFPRDGKMTSESAILAVGVYNLGFIGVSERSRPFLSYWKERLRRECRNDPGNMRFVDQRWVDFVPAMFDCGIVRNPRWNVAYWNLHERDVHWTGERYEVEGQQLGFFHFSGYSPASRHVLSRHQVERPRILLSEHPSLVKLFGEYGDALERSGFGSGSADVSGDYGLSRALNGVPLDRYVRKVYLEHLLAWEAGDQPAPPPDPFDPVGAKELLEWLNAVAPSRVGPSRLTLYQATLYAHQPHLHAEFPDPQGADYERFQSWLARKAESGELDPLLLPGPNGKGSQLADEHSRPKVEAAEVWGSSRHLVPGMTVVGYLGKEHSIGELGRLAVTSVQSASIPFQPIALDMGDGYTNLLRPALEGSVPRDDYDTNLVVVNADQFGEFARRLGAQCFSGRYTIAEWAWELEEFPKRWQGAVDLTDEIWAISHFTRAAIATATDKPVFAFPPPVVVPEISPDVDRATFGLDDGRFVFLFCFDFFSVVERKNPIGLIDAFCRAFSDGEGPLLLIKTVNGDSNPMDLELVSLAAAARSDVRVLDAGIPAAELGSLMQMADCYVSLHRSEGFGLTMAESMILGKPVIATAYSGNLDFMTEENSFLVPYTWAEVPPGADPYPAGARWAEPDLDVAASLIRKVVEEPDLASSVAAQGRRDMLEHHSADARIRFLRSRFDTIRHTRMTSSDSRAGSRATEGDATGALSVSGVSDLVRRGVRRASGQGLARHTDELGRAVSELALEVGALRSVHHASDVKRSDQDARLEQAVRDIGHRLGSLEERLASLERLIGSGEAPGGSPSGQ